MWILLMIFWNMWKNIKNIKLIEKRIVNCKNNKYNPLKLIYYEFVNWMLCHGPRDRKSLSSCRCHWSGNTLSSIKNRWNNVVFDYVTISRSIVRDFKRRWSLKYLSLNSTSKYNNEDIKVCSLHQSMLFKNVFQKYVQKK